MNSGSTRRQSLLRSISELEAERHVVVGAASAEDEEKRWLYGQIAALQRKIHQLETGQDGDARPPDGDPPAPASQSRLEQIDADMVRLRHQLDTLSSSPSSSSDELAGAQEDCRSSERRRRRALSSPGRPTNGARPAAAAAPADRLRSPQPGTVQAGGGGGGESDLVVSLLGLLRSADSALVTSTLLTMSAGAESGAALRQAGALPVLVQLIHCRPGGNTDGDGAPRPDSQIRASAARALHNLVRSQPDGRRARREARALRLLEQLREFTESLWQLADERGQPGLVDDVVDHHPVTAVVALMKLSFDEQQRGVLCHLGGLHGLAELLTAEHDAHGADTESSSCCNTRRFSGMALTNLTFGDGTNKALLCSLRPFMRALVAQLHSPSDDLVQVTASVVRNLSWRADPASKKTLREVGAVTALVHAALRTTREPSLKSILSALWNLSAHCGLNKAAVCAEEGALQFLVKTLSYDSPTKSPAVVENGGGILRNISSHVAVREDYRRILREHGCLHTLLEQLKSPSLTVVSNACGTLWNLSARCAQDQRTLWELGAVSQLRALVHSKHQMIANASGAALQNLLSARPGGAPAAAEPSSAPATPARRPRTAEEAPGTAAELPEGPPAAAELATARLRPLSSSRDSVRSALSDQSCDRRRRAEPPAGTPGTPERARLAGVVREVAHRLGVTETELRRLLLQPDSTPGGGGGGSGSGPGTDSGWSPRRDRAGSLPRELSAPRPASAQEHDASFHEEESDHPTDFSALYAEGREEDTVVFKKPPPPPPPPPLGRPPAGCPLDEDTVHTYATEGTPYQTGTPYNFSTATSLLDLREPPAAVPPPPPPPPPPGDSRGSGARRGPTASSAPASALETPLIFSRSSSMGSLSSFEGANATNEQGSVISEYSRQVSGAVSPSDLPDSPSQMPGTPQPPRKPEKHDQRGAKPADAAPQKAVTTGVFEEAPRQFQQEGTPLGFSRATSLSSLTIDEPVLMPLAPAGPPPAADEPPPAQQQQQQQPAAANGGDGSGDGGDGTRSADSGSSDDGDDDMIYACIKSAMPTRKTHSGRSARDSASAPPLPPRASSSSDSGRRSSGRHQHHHHHHHGHQGRRPTSSTSAAAAAAAAAVAVKSGSRSPGGGRLLYPRLSPRGRTAGGDAADSRRHRPPPPLIERNESDSGSCGDDMLEQMIQQTMGGKDDGLTRGGSPSRRVPGTSSAVHGQSWSVKQYHRFTERQAGSAARLARGGLALPPPPPPAAERPRQYAVEGTPVNFSRAESLSDLELDDTEPGERAAPPPPPPPPPGDMPTVYATEGTPGVFSRADSLSDICGAVERPSGVDGRTAMVNGVSGASDWRGASSAAAAGGGGGGGGAGGLAAGGSSPGGPAALSRPSSLSSLSLHSSGDDTDSATDDMLLERCISSAMPKTSRSDAAQRRRQRRKGQKKRRSGGGGSGDGEQWTQQQQQRARHWAADGWRPQENGHGDSVRPGSPPLRSQWSEGATRPLRTAEPGRRPAPDVARPSATPTPGWLGRYPAPTAEEAGRAGRRQTGDRQRPSAEVARAHSSAGSAEKASGEARREAGAPRIQRPAQAGSGSELRRGAVVQGDGPAGQAVNGARQASPRLARRRPASGLPAAADGAGPSARAARPSDTAGSPETGRAAPKPCVPPKPSLAARCGAPSRRGAPASPLLPPRVPPKPRVVSDRAATSGMSTPGGANGVGGGAGGSANDAASSGGRTPEPPPAANGDQSDAAAADGAPKRKSVIITSL